MKIKVLGTGCPNCLKLEQNVNEALEAIGFNAEVIKVADMSEIINSGVMRLPAVVIDEEVKISGRVASTEELQEIIKKEIN
jgi:small redox-active disulfide protein 2